MKEKTQKRIVKWFWILLLTPITAFLLLILAVWAFADIPSFEELENPESKLATQIIAEDGEILTTLSLLPSQPVAGGCGDCRRCIEACPTHAICEDGTVDARRCLSCQTIENRGVLPAAVAARMGMRVYGCDTCQQVCPYNEGALPAEEALWQPSEEMKSLSYERLSHLSREEFAQIFRHSAVKRVKYEGLMRNVNALNPALFEPRDKGVDGHCDNL